MDGAMLNALITFGGILLFAIIITLLDWLARRKERRAEHHKA